KSSRGDLVMTAYNDARSVRAVTLQLGQLVLYIAQLAGLMVAAWMMSPKLAFIGLLSVPLGAVPVYWLGQQVSDAGRRERNLAVMAVYSPVVGLLQLYGAVRIMIPNLDRLDQILQAVPEIHDRPGAGRLLGGPTTIELRNVSFAYRDQPVLSGISALIHRGETIGIVGPTGAGKSTLLSLLLRFFDPTDGAILFDGIDLRDLRYADLMGLNALVLQEPFLFIDTIANNIRIGRPDASIDEVVSAAEAANVHDEILQMELGYETIV